MADNNKKDNRFIGTSSFESSNGTDPCIGDKDPVTREEEETLAGESPENIITISDKYRNLFFILLNLVYITSSLDGGIIPHSNKDIKEDFDDVKEKRVGLFGSIDYIGRIGGAALMSGLIDNMSRKFFFGGCCIVKGFCMLMPFFTKKYVPNLIIRLASGIPQTLLTSYGTIWTDQFGKRKRKTMMLPLLQFSALVGIILGYALSMLSSILVKKLEDFNGWRLAFIIEGILLLVFGGIFMIYPSIYFSTTFVMNPDDDYHGREKSLKEIELERKRKENYENPEQGTTGKLSLIKQLPQILCSKLFIFMSIANTVCYFGMRVLQFYADRYMTDFLDVPDSVKFYYYFIICVTGPLIGVISGGIICSKLGGYVSKNGMIFILICFGVAALSSSFIGLNNNTFVCLLSCWIYLFADAASTPLNGGVIIASLPPHLKGNGYSVNMFFLNCIGSFPSSYVYSLICDFITDHYKGIGNEYLQYSMRITMTYNYVGLILALFAGYFRFKIKGDLVVNAKIEEKNKIDEEKANSD